MKNTPRENYQTSWDLRRFYESAHDTRIEKDQQAADRAVAAFAKKYQKSGSHLRSPAALAKAITEYEALFSLPASRAGYYAYYRKDLNSEDAEATALAAKLEERGTKRGNQTLFFALSIGKLPKKTQKEFLAARELAPFRYWLKQIFENAAFTRSEPEEKILSLKSDVSFGRWVQATERILNKQTVLFRKQAIPVPEAQGRMPTLPHKERREMSARLNEVYARVADVAESELNAIYTNKKIDDELRGFTAPYEATVRSYQNKVESVLALVAAVEKKASIAHRFYEAKRKLLKLPTLAYADRAAPVGSVRKKIPFAEGAALVREEFLKLDPAYAALFDRLLADGQVDIYPKKGKTGGAYCASGIGVPTMVLLNHTDSFESVRTLAHEMGHAIHAERAKTQRPLYQGHPISTAETASTFFEGVVLTRLMRELPAKDRIVALHDKIQNDIATIFRQVACFSFERSLHAAVRADGYVPKERIAALMNDAMQRYLGPAFTLKEEDGYFFVAWSHIRRFFYVYSYAYGQLVSKALGEMLAQDPAFIRKVDGFLAAGESLPPEAIFKTCGLDATKPALFLAGLASIEADVAELERLIK
jgi:oligoendopeptidase F